MLHHPKQPVLGLGMNSLVTVSRRVIEILNRLGQIASYHTIKDLETGLTFQETEGDNCTPTGMILIWNKQQTLHLIILTDLWKL